jgi:hypothetical protein
MSEDLWSPYSALSSSIVSLLLHSVPITVVIGLTSGQCHSDIVGHPDLIITTEPLLPDRGRNPHDRARPATDDTHRPTWQALVAW